MGRTRKTILYVYICRGTDHTVPHVGMYWVVNPLWPRDICRTTSGNLLVIRDVNQIHPSSRQCTDTMSKIEAWRDWQCQFQELRLPGAGAATVGRRLSLWLGGCQGHRGKGRSPLIGWLAVSIRDFGAIYLAQRLHQWKGFTLLTGISDVQPPPKSCSYFQDPRLKKPLKSVSHFGHIYFWSHRKERWYHKGSPPKERFIGRRPTGN